MSSKFEAGKVRTFQASSNVDSKPPSLMILEGQLLRLGVARGRMKRAEKTVPKYIFDLGQDVVDANKGVNLKMRNGADWIYYRAESLREGSVFR